MLFILYIKSHPRFRSLWSCAPSFMYVRRCLAAALRLLTSHRLVLGTERCLACNTMQNGGDHPSVDEDVMPIQRETENEGVLIVY